MKKLLYLFLAIIIASCSSDDNDGNSNSTYNYFRITANGQNYEVASNVVFFVGSNITDCNGNAAFEQYGEEIETASHRYSADLSHYNLTSDFQGVSTGSYPVKGDYIENPCNLTLALSCLSTIEGISYDNFTNGIHNVTSINQISSSNNETEWAVEGNFSGTFEDSNTGETLSLTGSYRRILYTYQD